MILDCPAQVPMGPRRWRPSSSQVAHYLRPVSFQINNFCGSSAAYSWFPEHSHSFSKPLLSETCFHFSAKRALSSGAWHRPRVPCETPVGQCLRLPMSPHRPPSRGQEGPRLCAVPGIPQLTLSGDSDAAAPEPCASVLAAPLQAGASVLRV